jgi:hypothetical protein
MKTRLLCACFMTLACSDDPPVVVFVAGEGFHETLHISTGAGMSPVIGVNEPLTLHARRTSGPWAAIPRAELQDEPCWQGSPPPQVEPEVADNVRWLVKPDTAAARFNIRYRTDHSREVRFSRPGVYSVTAQSNVSCSVPASVDTLIITVIDNKQ